MNASQPHNGQLCRSHYVQKPCKRRRRLVSAVAWAALLVIAIVAGPMSALSAPPVTLTFGDIGDAVWEVAFSPDGKVLAGCSRLGRIRLWDAETTTPVRTLDGHKREIPSLLFSPDGQTLASASYDDTIRL